MNQYTSLKQHVGLGIPDQTGTLHPLTVRAESTLRYSSEWAKKRMQVSQKGYKEPGEGTDLLRSAVQHEQTT
eukprot:CAMPEP_0182846766 /NCGR_PEP_ID=MMETSP0006_2-20121128/28079_1 /TAXON_ID=97485 /ORGANISM="Prymnesium parvum, Strain Texoma1" /LENGTH=71 /DNA_ID=CAMNT_0024977013 /DNA_START=667 /DNA_END=882 /DNA_ORIENTATION=+